jgi:putative nucleotidyltransferase with HDIG domain
VKLNNRFVHRSQELHPYVQVAIQYRYIIFALALVGIWMDYNVYTGKSLLGLYSLLALFLGLVYSNLWQSIVNSLLITIVRFAVSPYGFPDEVELILFQWLSFFAISFAVSSLVDNYIKQKENIIVLTSALANTIDSRDKYTAHHSLNVSRYAVMIANEMNLPSRICEEIKLASILHDIGKIGIPEHILNKPGKLTEEEYNSIKTHPVRGFEMVKHIQSFKTNGVLDGILYHHERENGSGYPEGLKGEDIPLVAKIIAVADSFDAMTSNRVYRKGNSIEYAYNEIVNNRGIYYDARVVDAFQRMIHREGNCVLPNHFE